MFRCPKCAKVHKLKLVGVDYAILPTTDMDEFWLVREPFYTGNLAKAFMNMLIKMDLDPERAGYNEKGELVIQPSTACKCSFCDHEDAFDVFLDAWQNPINYFDAENLCHCGTELWMDRVPKGRGYGMVCERCGWVKPNSVVSGSAEVTSQ